MSIERIQPHSDDAEKSVLGSVVLDKNALMDVIELIKPEDFYSEAHKEIFTAVRELYQKNEPIDTITVGEELKTRKTLEMVGGRQYLAFLSTFAPSTSNAAQYAKIIQEKSILRSLIKSSSDIMERGYTEKGEPSEILDFAERQIFEIAQKRQNRDYVPINTVIWENVVSRIDELAANGEMTGLTTGFKDIDKQLMGLNKSDLLILAARPGMGKTAFALNIAKNAAVIADASVLVFSLEMPKEQLAQRILSMESNIEMTKIRAGQIDDWEQFNMAVDTIGKCKIFIDDTPGITVLEMKNKCRRLKADKGLDLVIIDYLQLMGSEGRVENRQQEISTISRYLKQLAREMDCPVIALSQLSRAVEGRQDKRPMLSDLRESGSIEQDADIVMFLYRDDYYNEESERPNICEVIVSKQRNGAPGHQDLVWIGKYTKFADMYRS